MIEELLQNKSYKEKANIKAKEIAKIKSVVKTKREDIDIEIIGDIKEIDGGVEMFARAWKNEKQLGFGKDGSIEIERFRIFNPPILIDDINGNIIREWEDRDTKEIKQRKLKEDTEESLLQSLEHTIKIVGIEDAKIIKGKIGNTTSTFYSSSGDGAARADGNPWSTPHDAATADSVGRSPNNLALVEGTYQIRRGFFPFDTSAISDTDTIDSATFSFYEINDSGGSGAYDYIRLVSNNQNSNTSLVVADYDQLGTTGFATDKVINTFSAGYNDFSLNSTGLAAVSKTSYTKIGARIGYDVEDSDSGGANQNVYGYYADETGTTKDPKLVVVHSSTFIPKIIMS